MFSTVLVHSSLSIWCVTLELWLDPALHLQIVKFEWCTVRTVQGETCMRDPTAQNSHEEATLDPPVAGDRLKRIDLSGKSALCPKKVGQKPAWRKPQPGNAADSAGPGDAAGPAPAEQKATPRPAPRRARAGGAAVSPAPAARGPQAQGPLQSWAPSRPTQAPTCG